MARGTADENDDRSTGARPVTWAIGCAGRFGDPDIKPAPAITDDKPPDHQDHTTYGCSTRSRLAPTERRGQR